MNFYQELEDAKKMIMEETTLVVQKVLELGDGDVALGCIKDIEVGVLDHPFSPTITMVARFC